MILKQLINKSVYGTIGYISSLDDLDLLEQYIIYNLPVLKEYKQIVVATNYGLPLQIENNQLWKKYFPHCIVLNSEINRGHNFGTSDLDNMVFDWCKENNEEWLCKSANDILLQESILDKQIEEADFYYLKGMGYGRMVECGFELKKIMEVFYPQTNFYFINVFKIDYLNDKKHIDEIYNKVQNIPDYNGKAWEYGFKSCEGLLIETVKKHNLLKHHLVSEEKYRMLLQIINKYQIHDPSHKNIMIEGICHFQYSNQQIIEVC